MLIFLCKLRKPGISKVLSFSTFRQYIASKARGNALNVVFARVVAKCWEKVKDVYLLPVFVQLNDMYIAFLVRMIVLRVI